MNNSNPGSRTGSVASGLEDSGPLLDKTETTVTNNTNNVTLRHPSKSNRVNSTLYIPVNRSEKPVDDIVLLPGTEQFIKWSSKSDMEAGPNLNSPPYVAQYGSHYERVVNRKSHRSSHHGSHRNSHQGSHRTSHRSSRRSKHDSTSSRPTESPKRHPEQSDRQSYPVRQSQTASGHVISSLEIQVPDLVPTEVLTSPTGDFSETLFDTQNKPATARSDTNIFFPQFDHSSYLNHHSSKHWSPKLRKTVPSEIFTPASRSRESKPYLWKKVRGSSMPSLALQHIQSASYCANCQITTCPNCRQVLQTPIRSASHENFGSPTQPPVLMTPQAQATPRPPSHSHSNLRSKSNLTLTPSGVRLRHRHSSLMDFDRRSYASFVQDGSQPDMYLLDYRDLPRNIDFLEIEYIVPEDVDLASRLSSDKLLIITRLAKDVMHKSDEVDEMAKLMKEELDRQLEPSWHVIVGSDSYGSHLASLPGALVNFRIGKWVFLVWQT